MQCVHHFINHVSFPFGEPYETHETPARQRPHAFRAARLVRRLRLRRENRKNRRRRGYAGFQLYTGVAGRPRVPSYPQRRRTGIERQSPGGRHQSTEAAAESASTSSSSRNLSSPTSPSPATPSTRRRSSPSSSRWKSTRRSMNGNSPNPARRFLKSTRTQAITARK